MKIIMHLLLLSLCYTFSLLIFQNGFLLKRKELQMRIVLLVDALRYDFMVPPEDGAPTTFFRGQMPGVAKLMTRGGQIGLLLADPPTTTLQRIKALTTGTLPTFIDAGDNFSPSPIINEDNIFFQARSCTLNVTFMGLRSTQIFSHVLIHSRVLTSTISTALTMRSKSPAADLVIAHLLGVDHCGHKYGPNHIQMSNILWKMDKIIMETANALFENDLLIVLGDHGMTTTGDHGGDSDDETHAGLLVYSPSHKFDVLPGDLRQIDLVPTISLLLGLPIPFSNLGIVIDSLFPKNLTNQAIALNYEQMRSAMRHLQASLRAAWTQFDLSLMKLGLLCFIEALLFTLSFRRLTPIHYVLRSGCLLLQLSLIFGGSSESLAVPLLLVCFFFLLFSSFTSHSSISSFFSSSSLCQQFTQ
uniref:GPI ethanolamine phosphate transferase 3 n=1 Tax=Angiostrongylus cantonensis TaxID=6313 RepID=A0A0K0DAI4_ANGCA